MPKISVVVPVYNVEGYLGACLESLVAQTVEDFEVVLVNDGSTDGSVAIAEQFTSRDERFQLVSQENGGLSRARNTGTAVASGEYLAFLDSDDTLPPNAYELLLGALEKTGSDFATGNVQRLTRFSTKQSHFLARAFAETQMKTHVTKYHPLIADRTAWNKLWRRSFWDEHSLSFPEGVLHEDIPVVVPAHFMARSVDVISEPVYHWRIREDGDLSITQRRLETRTLRDRMAAIEAVSEYLAANGPRGAKGWYDEAVVADDLRYHLNVLESADDEYIELFMERVNAFLDRAGKRIYDPLPAIERLKWHLVRRRLVPELLEVLRFQKQDLNRTPLVRERGKWYGDYPFRTDRRLRIPRSVYRIEEELTMRAVLDELRPNDGKLEMRGYAYITGIGAASEGAQRLTVSAIRPGRLRPIRLRTSAVRLRSKKTHRPDVTANGRQSLCDLSWTGFEATLDPGDLKRLGRPADGKWEVYVSLVAGGLRRRRTRFAVDTPRPVPAATVPMAGDQRLHAGLSEEGELTLNVTSRGRKRPVPGPGVVITDARWTDDGALEVSGDLPAGTAWRELVIVERDKRRRHAFAIDASDGSFTATLTPARIDSLDGPLPVPEGYWLLYAVADDAEPAPVAVSRQLRDRLPLEIVVGHKPFALGVMPEDEAAVIVVRLDLDEDERGGTTSAACARPCTRRAVARACATRSCTPASSAGSTPTARGRSTRSSSAATHRSSICGSCATGAAACRRPRACCARGAASTTRRSRARYVVSNDHFPDWFVRRPDQVCLQTWHGTPFKRLGLDVSGMRKTVGRFERGWEQQVGNWQYVLSPNPSRPRSCGGRTRSRARCWRPATRASTPSRAPTATEPAGSCGGGSRFPRTRASVLYAPTYRDQFATAAAGGSTSSSTSSGCARPSATTP